MTKNTIDFSYCDQMVSEFEEVVNNPIRNNSKVYYTGVDLGTACVVIAVLDENMRPVAGAYEYADVVRDGMVVDYIGAVRIVSRLKQKVEEDLGVELIYAAGAIPPGTDLLDSGAVKNVIQGAGFELSNLLDESTAANNLFGIKNGAVVDIGGGTTGISVFKDGKEVFIVDEPTGGTHFSLVISGAYKMDFNDADLYKRNPENHKELLPVIRPVIEKVASIISHNVADYGIEEIYLAGGTCCFEGIETIIENRVGIKTFKPANPMFVTPLGIALGCKQQEMQER